MAQCLTNHDGLIDFIQKQRGGFEIKAKIDDYLKAYYEANSNIHQEIMHAIEEICVIEGIDGFHTKEFLSFKEETTRIENPQLEYAFSYILYLKSPKTYPGSLPNKMRDDWYDDTGCDNGDDVALQVIGIERPFDPGNPFLNLTVWGDRELLALHEGLVRNEILEAGSFSRFKDLFYFTGEKPTTKMGWLLKSSNGRKHKMALFYMVFYVRLRLAGLDPAITEQEICIRVDDFIDLSEDNMEYTIESLQKKYSAAKAGLELTEKTALLLDVLAQVNDIAAS